MHERVSAIVAESLELKRRYFAEHAEDVVRAASMIAAALSTGGTVLLCGNGGAAAVAQQLAGEFLSRPGRAGGRRALPALALSADGGVLTAVGDEAGFEEVFARQVEAFGERGDVLVAISESGASANVVRACEAANGRELKVIGLLGGDGGAVAALCDLALVVPSDDRRRTREAHGLVGHVLCELVERTLFPGERQRDQV
jgi:D-sedoheptulose 7-phosphate isomerase